MDAAKTALREIVEEWAGAECGEPVHAQEAYAIALARRMYEIAAAALAEPAVVKESFTTEADPNAPWLSEALVEARKQQAREDADVCELTMLVGWAADQGPFDIDAYNKGCEECAEAIRANCDSTALGWQAPALLQIDTLEARDRVHVAKIEALESALRFKDTTNAQLQSLLEGEDRLREENQRLRGPIRTAECVDWGLTSEEIDRQFRALVVENRRLRERLAVFIDDESPKDDEGWTKPPLYPFEERTK